MLNWLTYKVELYKAQKELAKCQRPYDKELRVLNKGKNKEKINELWAERQGCCQAEELNIEYVITKFLRSRANELGIPLPSYDDENFWQKDFGLSYYLTDKGKFETNKKIRLEMKERRDPIIQILAILIGLIGALTGLFSVFR